MCKSLAKQLRTAQWEKANNHYICTENVFLLLSGRVKFAFNKVRSKTLSVNNYLLAWKSLFNWLKMI